MDPQFTLLVHFPAQSTPRKLNILLKTKIFAKSTALGLIKNINLKPQKNIEKLAKNPIFWAQNEPKLLPGEESKCQRKFSHSLSQDHLSRVSTCQISASDYLLFLALSRRIVFLVQDQIRPIFWFQGNNFGKHGRLS